MYYVWFGRNKNEDRLSSFFRFSLRVFALFLSHPLARSLTLWVCVSDEFIDFFPLCCRCCIASCLSNFSVMRIFMLVVDCILWARVCKFFFLSSFKIAPKMKPFMQYASERTVERTSKCARECERRSWRMNVVQRTNQLTNIIFGMIVMRVAIAFNFFFEIRVLHSILI